MLLATENIITDKNLTHIALKNKNKIGIDHFI